MILTCSQCTTQFSISAGALGAQGRKVKCSRCGHGWFQAPEAPPPAAEAVQAAPAAAPQPPSALDREPVRAAPSSNAPVVPLRQPASPTLKLATVLAALLMMASAALAAIPVLKIPAMQEALGLADNSMFALEQVGVQVTPSSDEKMTIAFSGNLKNNASVTMDAPVVTVVLYDRAGREVRTLEYVFPTPKVEAGKQLAFEPRINNVPDSLSRVVLELGNDVERILR